ncbi:C-term transposase for IS2404 [Mycobacterium ulcerans subsp. shinshuense]|uniref:C-term transposase for IS2404 n=1 Tax=Mycobacterium ulcerans subsp. shinshuense TaxID=1124626 RepID=A0A1B4Y018_MYCUL|nr:C-term transposase for IS2404 [Mycobacterium ulcerans subsp. shinshuense]
MTKPREIELFAACTAKMKSSIDEAGDVEGGNAGVPAHGGFAVNVCAMSDSGMLGGPWAWSAAPELTIPCLRGALRAKATATHLVSVFAHRARLVLGQLAVAEKSNEIPCVRALLTLLPGSLRWLVTVDAMHTQVVTAKLICATLKSHYLMIVKSNQAKILARITALPWAEVPAAATDDSRGHGRVETRTLQIITAARGIGFPYAKQIIRITRERLITATDQRSVEVVYAICSLPFEHARPTAIMTWMRQHWGIENSLHWIRDVTFDEDRQRAHTGNGAQVLATLRNTAINLHRLNGADNIAEACRITALTANRRLDLLNPQFPSSQAC